VPCPLPPCPKLKSLASPMATRYYFHAPWRGFNETQHIHYVSWHCWQRFQGHRLKVTVIARSKKFWGWRDISVLSKRISMKLVTDIHHVNGNCWKNLVKNIGQRSKFMTRPNTIMAQAKASMVRRWGSRWNNHVSNVHLQLVTFTQQN